MANTNTDIGTILIFEKPELYFFPIYKNSVFPPYGVPVHSLRYWLYRALHLLRLPCCAAFWGEWKALIPQAGRVIIFDYGYQAGMERYIRKVNPDCQVYLFYWNIINKKRRGYKRFCDKNAIYSTDRGDCAAYGLRYNHMFYSRKLYRPYTGKNARRVFFLGVDKGRGLMLAQLKLHLARCGLECDIRLICRSRDKKYRDKLKDVLTDQTLSYPEYCEALCQCGILLDISQPGQQALTMRVMESIYFSKKLITDNTDIANYDFYDPNNILLLPDDPARLTPEDIRDFLAKPFVPYPDKILDAYDIEHWKSQFS